MVNLTINIEGEGEVTTEPTGNSYSYPVGEEVTVKANPHIGWEFYAWTGKNVDDVAEVQENETTINMDEDKEIIAFFADEAEEKHDIDLEAYHFMGAQGEVEDITGHPPYPPGFKVDIRAIPEDPDEHAFLHWSAELVEGSTTGVGALSTLDDPQDYFEDHEAIETKFIIPDFLASGMRVLVRAYFTSRTKPVQPGDFDFDHSDFDDIKDGGYGLTEHYWDISDLDEGEKINFYFYAYWIPDRFKVYYGDYNDWDDWGEENLVFNSGWVSRDPSRGEDPHLYPEGVSYHEVNDKYDVEQSDRITTQNAGKVEGVIEKEEGKDVLMIEVEGRDSGTAWQYLLDRGEKELTSEDLILAVESLQNKTFRKINWDIEFTSLAFAQVRNYRKHKFWADLFRVPLRIFQGTLSMFSSLTSWTELEDGAQDLATDADVTLDILGIGQVIHGVQDAGATLGYSMTLSYITFVEDMLEKADDAIPIFDEFDETVYRGVIENHLYGTQGEGIVPVPRKSRDIPRDTIEYRDGALEVYSEIGDTFSELKDFIEGKDIEDSNLIKELIQDFENLESQIIDATAENTTVSYSIYNDGEFEDYEVVLGTPAEYRKLLGGVASQVAENLKIEQASEIQSMIGTAGDAINLITIKYDIPGEESIEIVQRVHSAGDLALDAALTTDSGAEKLFYELPQKTLLCLPTELSILWMVIEDFDEYVRAKIN